MRDTGGTGAAAAKSDSPHQPAEPVQLTTPCLKNAPRELKPISAIRPLSLTRTNSDASRHAWGKPRVAPPAEVLTSGMPVEDEYEPSAQAWVREQVELYEGSGGTRGTTLRDTGLPVVIITNRGARSGKLRKTPLMRVEHGGRYAAVASQGGAPTHPFWYYNFRADPRVQLQDGPVRQDMVAKEVTGDERAEWWERAVAAYPPYAEYQQKTTRQIPVFVLEPSSGN
jgi:deazaflavin-dependent oxidoreductase (nitroreductase family)